MEHKEKASHLQISVNDIIEQLQYHIQFLQEVDDKPELKTKEYWKLAAFRYEKYWLPLVSKYSKPNLVAPLDVEWMWHCHLLAPVNYIQDCTKLVGKVINHKLRADWERNVCQDRARQLWSQMYEDEPFDVVYTQELVKDSLKMRNFRSCFSYDIIAASERQSNFFYNVSLPHYRDRLFLENALTRYKQFLYIKRHFPDAPLVPCYDIDLVWHTHMLNPIKYASDMTMIGGGLLHHDDTSTDTSVRSKLRIAGEMTVESWNSIFNERFKIAGTLNRGKSLKGHLPGAEKAEVIRNEVIEKGTININSLTVSGPNLNKRKLDNMHLYVHKKHTVKSTLLEGNEAKLSTDYDGRCNARWLVRDLNFEAKENLKYPLSFELLGVRKRKLNCCIRRESQNIFKVNTDFDSSKFGDGSKNEYLFLCKQVNGDFAVQVNANVTQKVTRIDLFLIEGNFSQVKTAEDVKSLLCDKTEEHEIIPYMKETCITAQHMLRNRHGDSNFSVRIFHCAPLMTSRIQVLCKARVVVTAELISIDQLPLPFQVGGDIPTLDPSIGERAVLIKNNTGDWAILIGSWVGYKRGKAGKKVQRCIINDKGENIVQEYSGRMETRGVLVYRTYRIPSCKKSTGLPAYLKVDFQTGFISMHGDLELVAENISLVFSVALLYTLCVPRNGDWKEGDPVNLSSREKLMKAVGLNMVTPSNHYITTHLEGNVCLACGMCNRERNDVKLMGMGFDGCACTGNNLEPAGCIDIDVKANDAEWTTVGRKNEYGDVIPIRRCGHFAITCTCDICKPKNWNGHEIACTCDICKPKNWNGHEIACHCRVCSCGPRCFPSAGF